MKMKNIVKISCLFIWCALVAISCKDSDENKGVAPKPILELSTTPGPGEVVLRWKNPEDPNLAYVNIVYTDSKGAKVTKNVSPFAIDTVTNFIIDTIDGFTNTNSYDFQLKSSNLYGLSSEITEIKANPLAPVYDSIIGTIAVEPDFGGIKVTWKNTIGRKANVLITHPDLEDPLEISSRTFDAKVGGVGYYSLKYKEGEQPEELKFTIVATDRYLNESAQRTFDITPLKEDKMDKKKWSVPGYKDDSKDETIGYSSQAINEGSSPNGRVIAVFDDVISDKNFWHANWGAPASSYPHWYIIDLGEEVTISRVEMVRRQGNGGGQKGQQFLTCTEAGAVDMTNSTTWDWQDQGTYNFNATINDAQSYRLTNNPTARYIKVFFPVEKKGTTAYAMVGEMTVFGQQ